MNIVNQGHKIRYRENSNDEVYTHPALVKHLLKQIKLKKNDLVLDPSAGNGIFYNLFPKYVKKDWCEINKGKDFLKYNKDVDWIISNPPYSILNDFLQKSCDVANVGFAYLIGSYAITPKRLELIEKKGFFLTDMHILKVSEWFGNSCLVIFKKSKNKPKVNITFSRKVWKAFDNKQKLLGDFK